MEPAPVEVVAGSSPNDSRSTGTLTVTGERRTVDGEARAFLSETTISRERLAFRPLSNSIKSELGIVLCHIAHVAEAVAAALKG